MTASPAAFDTVIVGLGKTGLSCARYLQRRGEHFAVTDSRDLPPELSRFRNECPDVTLTTGRFDEDMILKAGRLLLSPGVAPAQDAIEKARALGIPVLGDVELFCREARAPIVAVTGSNGKSTVVSLFRDMAVSSGLQVQLGGNIGTPVLDMLNGEVPDLYVLELSSFQLELTRSLNAAATTVLNVSEDHMDRYPSLKDYADAKAVIYAGDGRMVINLDDPLVKGMYDPARTAVCYTGNEPEPDQLGLKTIDDSLWLMDGATPLLDTATLKIRGRHNYLNALAALALGKAIGLSMPAMLEALREFPGLPHRCQWVRRLDGIDWYNDSKGTNVGASCAAIESLAGDHNMILIAGGDGKGADFTPLRAAASGHVRVVVTIGRDGPRIGRVLQDLLKVIPAGDMDEAVQLAQHQAGSGDVVLLSPACASLDMFRDYTDRGLCFIDAVERLEVNE